MKTVSTQIDLDASPARVYAVLADLPRYADWNPVIPSMRGEPRVGARVDFRIEIAGLPGLKLSALVCLADPARGFGWRGGVPGLFTGEHTMRMSEIASGRTRLIHGEDFRGGLAALGLSRGTLLKIEQSYVRMNEALAARLATS